MPDAPKDRQKPADSPDPSAPRQLRVNVDERSLQTAYSNAFRSNGSAEEVILDFGLNVANPAPAGPEAPPQVNFHVTNRIILNYYSAKRLAIALSQLVRRHEDQFGELELDVNKRRKDSL